MTRLRSTAHSDAEKPSCVRLFLRNDNGNVAMLFGLLLLPMIGAVGLAVDFGQALTARNKAQVAADAAVLQASGVARDLIQKGDGGEANTNTALAEAKARARSLFDAYANQTGLANYTFEPKVIRAGQVIETSGDYTIRTQNFIARIFGQESYNSAGIAKSSSSLPTYADVYMALDMSQSMGVAATSEEMRRLFLAKVRNKNGTSSPTNCVFGCHAIEGDHAESYMDVAERAGIRLRIDILRDAVKTMIQTADEDAGSAAIYQFALYGMWMNASRNGAGLLELAKLSNDYSKLETAAGAITLGSSPGNNYSDSFLNENLATFNNTIPMSGTGSSQNTAKKFAFIVTDGVRDIPSGAACFQTGNRCVSAVAQTSCDAMKAKGITVGVLYTTYLPATPYVGTDWYQVQVVNTGVAAKIAPALKACASDGWYFEAADAGAISKAMKTMFEQITSTPALIN